VTAAHGADKLESVELHRRGKRWSVACDYLACGFHLVPNLELAELLGCDINDGAVRVDEFQQTSVPHVYAAGESTGIGGLELSLVEGEIAGLGAAGSHEDARRLFPERAKQRRFADLLNRTFALRDELKTLAVPETIVCRCEDVVFDRLRAHDSWRAAKLQTRCGMGPCQGRICGSAVEFLFGWKVESVRPPILPVRVESLLTTKDTKNQKVL
jgi:NADPH-dependent 2,4-dienoyl-CoA reductase/sulfur reductase-like enzyme